jgi:hypothetical protein
VLPDVIRGILPLEQLTNVLVVLLFQKSQSLVVIFLHIVHLSVNRLKELQTVKLHRQHALLNWVQSAVKRLSCDLDALSKLIVKLYLDLRVFVLRVITCEVLETFPELIITSLLGLYRLQPGKNVSMKELILMLLVSKALVVAAQQAD